MEPLPIPSAPPTQDFGWPNIYDPGPLPRDGVLYVVDEAPDQPDPTLTAEDGSAVPFATHRLPDTRGQVWRVLVPDEDLAPGRYVLRIASGDSLGFDVVDDLAEPAAPPGRFRRDRGACDPADVLRYRVCGGGVVHLVATGAEAPPEPTLDAPGDALVGHQGEEWFDVPLDGGWPATVWIGDLDPAGRFGGWWPADLAERPDEGTRVTDAVAGTTTGPSATPTAVPTCPSPDTWQVLATDVCASEPVGPTSCGCSAPAPGAGPVLGLVLVAWRRRSPRG